MVENLYLFLFENVFNAKQTSAKPYSYPDHLELDSVLTAEQFVLAFRRFAARRSLLTTVVTNNATYVF